MKNIRLNNAMFFSLFTVVVGVALILATCMQKAEAITPPAPVAPVLASVLVTIKPATTRNDNVTPLALSEIKEHRLYFTQLAAYIAVPMPALTYTYIIPAGQCFKATDAVAGTTVDTVGMESAGSASVSLTADRCSGKPLPAPPGVTAG